MNGIISYMNISSQIFLLATLRKRRYVAYLKKHVIQLRILYRQLHAVSLCTGLNIGSVT